MDPNDQNPQGPTSDVGTPANDPGQGGVADDQGQPADQPGSVPATDQGAGDAPQPTAGEGGGEELPPPTPAVQEGDGGDQAGDSQAA